MKRHLDFAPLTVRLPRLPRLSFPMLGIDATINGVFTSIQTAACLVCFDPFTVHQRRAVRVTDADLDGRDPNW